MTNIHFIRVVLLVLKWTNGSDDTDKVRIDSLSYKFEIIIIITKW